MRVAGKMECTKLPREEAMELLAPRWNEFVHKGVVELAAKQPESSSPSCTRRKRGRRKARRPDVGDTEEAARDKRPPPPPPSDPENKKTHEDVRTENEGSDSGASATSEPAIIRKIHDEPRWALFTPIGAKGFPANKESYTGRRITFGTFVDGEVFRIADNWLLAEKPHRVLDKQWVGTTTLELVASDGGASAISRGGPGGGTSAPGRAEVAGELELAAAPRRAIEGQRVGWTWLVDSGASLDIVCQSDVLKSRILARTLESPFPFQGIGGLVYADEVCRNLFVEELGLNLSPNIVKCAYNLLSVGQHCQEDGVDFVWLGSRKMLPYFICKNGAAVVMRVDYNIPYLDCAGKRGVRPRGVLSKQVRLPLPPSRPGVYTPSQYTAAAGTATTAFTDAATMTIRVKRLNAATQTDVAPGGVAASGLPTGAASGSACSRESFPAQAADEQAPAAFGEPGTASGAGDAVDGAGGGGRLHLRAPTLVRAWNISCPAPMKPLLQQWNTGRCRNMTRT